MERFDFNFPPYEFLTTPERNLLQNAVNISFFEDETVILEADQSVDYLYTIIKGLVREVNLSNEIIGLYHPRDSFEPRALVQGYSANRLIVQEEALVYTIPKKTITELIQSNPQFGAYFYANVAEKLSSMVKNSKVNEFESLFTARVRDAYRGNTVWLDGNDSILHAAGIMKQAQSKSIILHHEGRFGLFTESAFRDIIIAGAKTSDPVWQWSPVDLITIDIDDYVFNALLRMTQFKIQRVVVTENSLPIGTLEQIDILAYFSNHTHLVAQRIERAQCIDELIGISEQMVQSIRILHNNGVRAPQLAQLMQVLNTNLFEKTWRLIAPTELYNKSCLIVMGSEGRGEQILKTDQDNALILDDSADIEMARIACEKFSQVLSELGYPLCKGQIMVNNPMWRKTLSEFKTSITQWCYEPDGTALLNLAIFIDAKAVAGDFKLLEIAKEHLHKIFNNNAGMMSRFAQTIELFDSHSSGFFSQLLNRDTTELMDIKKMGIFPVVHGIRALSLETRITETNTFERINRLALADVLDKTLAEDLSEAFTFMMGLRLKAGLSSLSLKPDELINNQVDTLALATLERDLLKEALQVVKRFKSTIRQHFHLGNL